MIVSGFRVLFVAREYGRITRSMDYRDFQHQQIANLNGTSVIEVSTVLAVMPTSYWFYCELTMALYALNVLSKTQTLRHFLVDYVVLVLPLLLSFTWTHLTMPMIILFCTCSMMLKWLNMHASDRVLKMATTAKADMFNSTQKGFVTCFRAQMMLAT